MASKPITTIFAVLLLSGFVHRAFAQDTKPDLNAPGEQHRKLNALVGAWDVSLKIPVGPGRHIDGKSSCEARWVMDGRFVRLEYTSTFRGKPLTVVRYVGFDRYKDKFVEVQFESTHTDVMQNEGSISSDGTTITTLGSHVDTAAGKAVKVRSVTSILDENSFKVELFYGEGADAKTVSLMHNRKKG